TALIINTSRGAIVDEAAMLDALLSGAIAGAAVDVLSSEPELTGNRLVDYARNNLNLLITPHIGGFAPESVEIVCERAAQKIKDFSWM
ncbi:MAG: NAD(P)-dependent oxidoreductase, partial [Gammaproteobacteria bacterium]